MSFKTALLPGESLDVSHAPSPSPAYVFSSTNHSSSSSSNPTPVVVSADSTQPPVGVTAAHPQGVRHFDVLHHILLTHIKRSNSDAVMALLTLPQVKDSALFWRTCTYRGGILEPMLTYVVEHAGQTSVNDATEKEARVRDGQRVGPSGSPADSPTAHSTIAVVAGDCAGSSTALLAVHLHCLLQRCLSPDQWGIVTQLHTSTSQATFSDEQTNERGSDADAGVSAFAAVLTAFLRDWVTPQAPSCADDRNKRCATVSQDGKDLRLYIESVMRELEALMASVEQQPHRDDAGMFAASHERKRPRDGTASGPSVDLAALAAVLVEHFSAFTYVNPFSAHLATDDSAATNKDMGDVRTAATSLPSPARASSAITAVHHSFAEGGVCNTSQENASASSSQAVRQSPSLTSMPIVVAAEGSGAHSKANMKGSEAQAVLGEEEKAHGHSDETEVDAVAMLQQLTAIAATRWAVPPMSHTEAKAVKASSSEMKAKSTPDSQTPPAPVPTPPPPPPQPSGSPSVSRPEPRQPLGQGQGQQQDAEQARVSAAIRAFDAFTASLGGAAGDGGENADGFVNAQRHRGGTATASTAAPPSSSSDHGHHHQINDSKTTTRTSHAPQERESHEDPAQGPTPALTSTAEAPLPQSEARVIKRRYKFSAQEDSAIIHGVARFGQGTSAFQYIFHAYRAVWRAGRTPLHLYDHWRGALRRRAVSAVSEVPLEQVEAGQRANANTHTTTTVSSSSNSRDGGREGAAGSGRRARLSTGTRALTDEWGEQELSSDIEDSSTEDA